MSKSYLDDLILEENAPLSDNPSGMYCTACRSLGLHPIYHCAFVEYCGEMKLMKPKDKE